MDHSPVSFGIVPLNYDSSSGLIDTSKYNGSPPQVRKAFDIGESMYSLATFGQPSIKKMPIKIKKEESGYSSTIKDRQRRAANP
jgi:hypothetical protein